MSEPESHRTRARRPLVILMVGITMMSYVNRTAMSIVGPDVMKRFSLTPTELGSIYSAFLLSYALLMVPGGWLADRFGPHRVVGIACFVTAILTFLTAAAGYPAFHAALGALLTFQIIRLLLGAATAPLFPGCGRLTSTAFEKERHAQVQALVLGGAPLGAAITPVVLAPVVAIYGWQTALYLCGAATVVLSAIWWIAGKTIAPREVQAERAAPGEWRSLFRNKTLLSLNAGYFALNYFEYIFFYWMYYYFGEIRKVGATQSAVYTTILLLTMAAAMPAAGWISDQLIPRLGATPSRRLISVGGMVFSALLLFAGTRIENEYSMVAMLSLALGFASAAEGPFWAATIDESRSNAGAACGLLNGIGNAGGFLAPIVTPYLAQRAGWSAGMYFGSLVVFAGAACWFFVRTDSTV